MSEEDAEKLASIEAARVRRVLASEVEAEADRVKAIIEALRVSNVEITPDVVIRAIRAASDWVLDSDYTLLPSASDKPKVRRSRIRGSTTDNNKSDYTELNLIIQALTSTVNDFYGIKKQFLAEIQNLHNYINRLKDIIEPRGFTEKEDIKEEIKHQHELKKQYIKRIHVLEIDQAKRGINTPSEVEIEINDVHNYITECEAKIKLFTYELDHFSGK
jgi:hypothetical protein